MAIGDAIDRLKNFYNAGAFNQQDNPGGMARGGHRVNFLDALDDVVTASRNLFQAESTTSLTVAKGSKTLTVTQSRPYFAGAWVRIERSANSGTYMAGEITSYDPDSGTDNLTLDVRETGGSGTHSDWVLKSMGRNPNSFKWQSDWQTGTAYLSFSIVRYTGDIWLAPEGAAADEEPGVSAAWEKLDAESISFRGDWDSGVAYENQDVVRHSAELWIADQDTTAGDEPGVSSKWSSFLKPGFNWQGDWDSGTAYNQLDTVAHSGKVWLAEQDTSAGDEPGVSGKWQQVVDRAVSWAGVWGSGTSYVTGSLVHYDGDAWIATADTAAGEEPGVDTKWTLFAAGLTWRGAWDGGTSYAAQDVVEHNNATWVAKTSTAAGDEPGSVAAWERLTGDTFDFQGAWASDTAYQPGDVVKHRGGLHVATQDTAVGDEPRVSSKWNVLVDSALNWRGTWQSGQTYVENDAVNHNNAAWIATAATAAGDEPGAAAAWERLTGSAPNFRGDWQSGSTYQPNDVVRRGSTVYVAVSDSGTGDDPQTSSNWDVFVESALNWRGAWDSGVQYVKNDGVNHDGAAWIATEQTALGDEPGVSSKWSRMTGSALNYKGIWDSQVAYDLNDLVTHQNSVFVANQDTSAGDEPGVSSKWDTLLSPTLTWRGAWDGQTAYQKNEAVRHNGTAWIATESTDTGDEPGVSAKWDTLVEIDFHWEGSWGSTAYSAGAVVEHRGSTWFATTSTSSGDEPGVNSAWARFATGFSWRGGWDSQTAYRKFDVVEHQEAAYIANQDTSAGDEPGVSSKWDVVTDATITWRGQWDSGIAYNKNDAVAYQEESWIANQDTNAGDAPKATSKWDKLAGQGDPGSSSFDWKVVSSDGTEQKDDRVMVDTSGGAVTRTLPASPPTGAQVSYADAGATWNGNNLTVDGNNATIEGGTTFTGNVDGGSFVLIYNGTEWKVRFANGGQ